MSAHKFENLDVPAAVKRSNCSPSQKDIILTYSINAEGGLTV